MPTVEPLTREDLPAVARVLAHAFRDNPGMMAMLPGASDEIRLRLLVPCMEGFAASVLRYGVAEVVKEGGHVVAVSMSFRPGEFPPPFYATVIQAWGPLRAGLSAALRIARIDHEMRKRHPHYRHWYLWFLGVEPERQGQGLGSLLLRSLSRKAKEDGEPCYLETDKPSSVKIYERHGYRVESEETIAPVSLRLMVHEAAGVDSRSRWVARARRGHRGPPALRPPGVPVASSSARPGARLRGVNVNLLIDAIVRQTTVLIAELATISSANSRNALRSRRNPNGLRSRPPSR